MTRVKLKSRQRSDPWARFNPAHLYGHYKPTPAVIAYAAAEWEAMDDHGNLPDGWEYEA